jgi:hypothetical protein
MLRYISGDNQLCELQKLLDKLPDISIPTWSWFLGCLMVGFLIANDGSLAPKRPGEPFADPVQNSQVL